jgi:phenylacetate-CoA ligase
MTDPYAAFYRNALHPAWESVVRRRPTLRYLRELERTQWYSAEELESLKDRAFARLIRHACDHVPYYREWFESSAIAPEDFGAADIGRLPLLTRDAARASFEARKATCRRKPAVFKMTSGSTGQPLAFAYDWESEYRRNAMRLRGYAWAGYRPGDNVVHYWGSLDALYPKQWHRKAKVGLDRALRRETYVDCGARSAQDLDRTIETIRRVRPKALVCYAQAGAALARHVNATSQRTWDVIPVICGAERVFDGDREALLQAFGPVFETYGSRELMLIGAECEAHDGMHVSAEHLIVEVLVREGEAWRSAEPGETGEIAVTDLYNYGAPFIRYLTGDLGVWAPPSRCRCGRASRRQRSIEGRTNDSLRDATGRQVDSLFFNVLFSVLANNVRQFQAVQKRDGSVRLKIVPTAAFDDELLRNITANCSKVLRGVDFRAEVVQEIPLGPNGKLRPVMVER